MSTTSKIDVFCPQCKAKLAVPVAALGKSGKCPHCLNVFPLAMPAPRPAAAAPVMAAASPLSPLSPFTPSPYADSGLTPLGSADLMPLSDGGLTPMASSSNLAPLGNGNPFGSSLPQGDYTLQSMAPAPYAPTTTLPSNSSIASEYLSNANASYAESKSRKYYSNDGEGWGINAGIGGGALMMLLAIAWFVLGLMADRIYPYPLFMFIVGLIAFFKGIADNFSE
jgi:hypothetical protein